MKIAIVLLLLLNLMLVGSNCVLHTALKSRTSEKRVAEEAVRKAANNLAGLEVRLANKERLLNELSEALESAEAGNQPTPQASDGTPMRETLSIHEDLINALTSRPDPASVPLLSSEQMDMLRKKRSAMPRSMGVMDGLSFLAAGVQDVLEDPAWNPQQRELTKEEELTLSALLGDYRYFARVSQVERLKAMRPEIERMRDAGAFIEYPAEEAPPDLDGHKLTHVGPSPTPGLRRLYLFFEEDYPHFMHQFRVEKQRSLDTLVKMYELINGPVEVP